VPITIFWAAFFLTYLLLAALAPELMGERVLGVSLGFLLSVAQVLMTWLVGPRSSRSDATRCSAVGSA
jgi:uncharacterized membrane protein (DUF485 family)